MFQKFLNIFKKKEIYDEEFFRNLPVKDYPKYIKEIYKERTGKNLNLENPRTIAEKIQWLKLYDNLPIKTVLTDKLLVKDWVAKQTDKLLIPKVYGVWDSFDEIDFKSLPNRFMLKTNHGCQMNMAIHDNSSYNEQAAALAKATFDKWMKTNFAYSYGFELQYKNIVPKIFAEELQEVESEKNRPYPEYKIMCFNGKAKFIEQLIFISIREFKRSTHSINWEVEEFSHNDLPVYEKELPRPKNLELMVEIAEKLAKDFKFVRVDIREVNGELYFGELTFTPCSGHMTYFPDKYNLIIGDMLDLDIKNNPKIIHC